MKTVSNVEIGTIFNHLEFLSFSGKNKHGKRLGWFRCLLCSSEKELLVTAVKNGYSKTCGCLSRERARERMTKHGLAGTKVYRAWKGMRQRCLNPNYGHFDRYGGRGISFAKEWNDFKTFYKDMGEPPTQAHQLDRIDNDGDYSKENCRWVLPKENCNNRSIYKNKTGYTGVVENTSKKGRYSAYFIVDRRHKQVGTFGSPEEAYKARVEAIKAYNKANNTKLKYIEIDEL